MHFLHLLAVCWPGAQNARDNHALACDVAKHSPILNFFTGEMKDGARIVTEWLLELAGGNGLC